MSTVSVVIPSFRGGRYLREAIASVQAQTLKNWELIVVLDGCNDDLTDVERADQRIRIIRQQNRGESLSRNVGIKHAASGLVALLDDDDRMLPDRLDAQLRIMSDANIGVCHTQFRIIDENGESIGMGTSKESQYRDFLRDDGAILISTAMIRKTLIEEVGGFSPLLPMAGDLDLLYRIARESTFHFIPEVLTEYRRHESNTWSNPSLGGEVRKAILRQHLFVAKSHDEMENLKSIRRGLSRIPTDRVGALFYRAHQDRVRHDFVAMTLSLAKAFLLAPAFTLKLSLRRTFRHRTTFSPSNDR